MASYQKNCVEKISSEFDKNYYELVYSLNRQCCDVDLINNASVIIVGTLTPANGMGYGYYYTSERNKVYGILDYCFETEENGLVILKKKLRDSDKKEIIIEDIKQYLKAHKIAFIDVINQAVRKIGSSKDDDIIEYTLDYDLFKHCNNNQKFICTSQNAKICLDKINKFDNVVICHQDRFHCKKEDWKKEILNITKKR